jgi:hypothetical protein
MVSARRAALTLPAVRPAYFQSFRWHTGVDLIDIKSRVSSRFGIPDTSSAEEFTYYFRLDLHFSARLNPLSRLRSIINLREKTTM